MYFRKEILRAPVVLLMGGPGSGKGVLAELIRSCEHLSLGELLRKRLANPTNQQAVYLKERMQAGQLLPDKEVLDILTQQPAFKEQIPILLDGFPRTLHQWDLLKSRQIKTVAAIDISVSRETMRRRLLHRGRADDQLSVIEHRIQEYYTKTKPMSDQIRGQIPNSIVIPADELTPEEVAAAVQDFLDSRLGWAVKPRAHPASC